MSSTIVNTDYGGGPLTSTNGKSNNFVTRLEGAMFLVLLFVCLFVCFSLMRLTTAFCSMFETSKSLEEKPQHVHLFN